MLSDSERANYKSMSVQQLRERRENLDLILHHLKPSRRDAHRACIAEELLLRGDRA